MRLVIVFAFFALCLGSIADRKPHFPPSQARVL